MKKLNPQKGQPEIELVDLHMPPHDDDGYVLSPNYPFRLAILAPSNSGKSFLISKMLLTDHPFLRKAFYKVNFIDPTFKNTTQNNPYKYIDIPEENIYEEATDGIVNNIFHSVPRNPNNDKVLPSLCVLDDTGELSRNSVLAKRFFLKARHYGISLIGSFQKLSFLPLSVRENLSHIILFRSQNKKMLEDFCEEFMPYDKEINMSIIKYATTPDEDHKYPFLFCNLEKHKYYKCFDTEIIVKDNNEEN